MATKNNESLTSLNVKKNKTEVTIQMLLSKTTEEVELCILSDANMRVIEYCDVSKYAPGDNYTQAKSIFDASWAEQEEKKRLVDRNLYFPVIDIKVQDDMEGFLQVNKTVPGKMSFNGNFIPKNREVKERMYFSASELEHWENAILFDPNNNTIDNFGIRTIIANTGEIQYSFHTLREDWSGEICVYSLEGERKLLAKTRIDCVNKTDESVKDNKVLNSLSWTIKYILKCINEKEDSPTYGGTFLLYDMDARTFLRSDWPWTWGIVATLLLKASKLDHLDIDMTMEELREIANSIADATLEQQIIDPKHQAFGLVRTTNEPGSTWEHGFQNRASTADTLYLVGWTWIPFYKATGDVKYLEASKKAADAAGKLMEQYSGTMIPQAYDLKDDTFYGHMFFETSMGIIGLSRVYMATKEDKYKKILKEFVNRLLVAFKREDGLWDTWIHEDNDSVATCNYFTKSFGYCVEGLLEAHIALPEGGFLEQAEKISELVLEAQFDDGSWAVRWDRSAEEVGKTDKGTALWALLFTRLYKITKNEKYKIAGDKAINWCMDHQYFGEDLMARGGIVGRSWTSGIVYRHWFDMITTYTMGFYGNAIVEGLEGGYNESN